jgi:hypothetical protein
MHTRDTADHKFWSRLQKAAIAAAILVLVVLGPANASAAIRHDGVRIPDPRPTDPSLNGSAPDIGADELQLTTMTSTMTSLSCPPSTAVGSLTSCTAIVSSSPGLAPTGTVRFSSDGPGSFTDGGSCTLARGGKDEAGLPGCDISYIPSAIGSGRHAIIASYQGDAVYSPSQSSAALIRVLTKAQATPNTTLKKKPPRRGASRTATFSFASDIPGSVFDCKLDRKPFEEACRSPLHLKRLKPGRHILRVRAIGPVGIADPTPAIYRWTVS